MKATNSIKINSSRTCLDSTKSKGRRCGTRPPMWDSPPLSRGSALFASLSCMKLINAGRYEIPKTWSPYWRQLHFNTTLFKVQKGSFDMHDRKVQIYMYVDHIMQEFLFLWFVFRWLEILVIDFARKKCVPKPREYSRTWTKHWELFNLDEKLSARPSPPRQLHADRPMCIYTIMFSVLF